MRRRPKSTTEEGVLDGEIANTQAVLEIFRQQPGAGRHARRLYDESIPEGKLKSLADLDGIEDRGDVDLYREEFTQAPHRRDRLYFRDVPGEFSRDCDVKLLEDLCADDEIGGP